MTIALMYHALYDSDEALSRIDSEDRPYAVSLDDFKAQMAIVAKAGHGLLSILDDDDKRSVVADQPRVIVTFDDGHISNHDLALPILDTLGIQAYFFITTDYIGERVDFCRAEHLQTLQNAGMKIGGHGASHRFFDDLSSDESLHELRQSKRRLEDIIGVEIDTMSFPGGRCNKRNLEQARDEGYRQIFGSEFGIMTGQSTRRGQPLRRIAIRNETPITYFQQLVAQDSRVYIKERIKHTGKYLLKRLLGNTCYHGLYKIVASIR